MKHNATGSLVTQCLGNEHKADNKKFQMLSISMLLKKTNGTFHEKSKAKTENS